MRSMVILSLSVIRDRSRQAPSCPTGKRARVAARLLFVDCHACCLATVAAIPQAAEELLL